MGEWEPLARSVQVAVCATIGIVIVGLPAAWVLARTRFPGKDLLAGILLLPLVLPPTVLGFLLLQMFSRRGMFGHALEHTLGIVIVFHWTGAVAAAIVTSFPLFLLPCRAALEAVDPDLEDAARLLGHNEWSVFRRITFPLARRGCAAGIVLAFVRALGDFGATLMVAGNIPGRTQTASLAIYDAVQVNDLPRAARMAAAVSAIALLALWTIQRGYRSAHSRKSA